MYKVKRIVNELIGNTRLNRGLFVFSTGLLIFLNVSPGASEPLQAANSFYDFRFDYLAHALALFVWGALFVFAFFPHTKKNVLVVLVISFTFSVALELTQQFVPGRIYNPMDMFFNIMGSLTGVYISRKLVTNIKTN